MRFTLNLTSRQAKEISKAVELLMRLKIGQSFTFSDMVAGFGKGNNTQKVDSLVKLALDTLYPNDSAKKDEEWHILYDIYQTINKTIHDTEHPETTGVDSYPIIKTSSEPLPRME